jgi:alcohol dehydrogenase class IV
VVFGTGQVVEAAGEARRLGGRVLVVCDQIAMPVADRLASALDSDAVGMIAGVRQHVPVADAEAARGARELDANCVLAVGGGSTLGLAKAITLTERVPIVAVPTTYAGSELTPVWGLTDGGVKTTGRDPVVAPRTVIYDPELTYGLPPDITAASGLNAIAHCVDSLWAPGRTPLTDAIAERGIASLAAGLAAAVRDGCDRLGRENALIGAWLAGVTFAVAGSSLHHKLCHVLGGKYDLPHAKTHAAVLRT